MKLLLATQNTHKTEEVQKLLGSEWEVKDLTSLQHLHDIPEIKETGTTFTENAFIKALAISALVPETWIIADDSGLEVDALDGAPGVHSARYASAEGEGNASDSSNRKKLLDAMQGVENQGARTARFRCALALVFNKTKLGIFEGTCEGTIAHEEQGKNGFGYDPLFIPQGYEKTFAQLPPQIKDQHSHRAKAVQAMADFLKEK